jgi:hypothetical protein
MVFTPPGGQHRLKRCAELGVAIMHYRTAGMKVAPRLLRRGASDLFHPRLIWMARDSSDVDPAGLQVKKEQHIVGHEPAPGKDLHREEIGSRQHTQVRGDKILPRSSLTPLRRRCDSMAAKDVSHRLIRYCMAQVGHRDGDAIVAPARVLGPSAR